MPVASSPRQYPCRPLYCRAALHLGLARSPRWERGQRARLVTLRAGLRTVCCTRLLHSSVVAPPSTALRPGFAHTRGAGREHIAPPSVPAALCAHSAKLTPSSPRRPLVCHAAFYIGRAGCELADGPMLLPASSHRCSFSRVVPSSSGSPLHKGVEASCPVVLGPPPSQCSCALPCGGECFCSLLCSGLPPARDVVFALNR